MAGRRILVPTCMFEGLLQPMHLILILAIVMIFFGPKKLPELGRGLGEAIRGFKDGLDNGHKDPKPDDTKPVPRQES
jgi:sec-independent protein translocase protein TatA